jgi:hypothetical protein
MNKFCRLWLGLLPLILGSCEVFSTSWASWAARDLSKVEITVDNIEDLIDEMAGDPKKSLELLQKLEQAVKNASPGDKATLQAAALDVAINAAGLVSAALDSVSTLLDALDSASTPGESTKLGKSGEELLGILNKLQNTSAISSSLNSIIGEPSQAFQKEAGTTQLMMAGLILAYDDVAQDGEKVTLQSFEDHLSDVVKDDDWKEEHPNLKTALGCFEVIAAKENSTFNSTASSIVDMLEGTK